jgi:hypothetical protein
MWSIYSVGPSLGRANINHWTPKLVQLHLYMYLRSGFVNQTILTSKAVVIQKKRTPSWLCFYPECAEYF